MSGERAALEPLLAPKSIAVVGASPDSWYTSQLVDNALEYGHDGPLYLVNPNRETAWNRTCYDELGDIPEPVDLVVVSVPREYVVGVIEQAEEMDIPAAMVITAGFAESDERGEEIEAELAAVTARSDINLCGPNCIGLANTHDETVITSTCSRKPTAGSIGLISHSGALAFTTFFERGEDEDTGFAYVVSTGNEVDLALTDYIEYMGNDDRVEVITAYVEGVEDPRRLMRVADAVTRAGTPILTIKVGQSESADAATISHTGSLTGNDDAWEAAFTQTGVQRVADIPDLLANAHAHASFDPPASNRVCIASTSGGLASLLADLADLRGLDLPAMNDETEQALLDTDGLLTFGSVPNPADIRGYGADHLPEIASILFADDTFDAYLFAIGMSGVDERAAAIAEDLVEVAEMTDDPVFFLWTGRKEASGPEPLPYERLREVTPLYYDPKRCVEALASLTEFGDFRARTAARPSRTQLLERSTSEAGDRLPEDTVLSWERATGLLEAAGLPPVSGVVATSSDEAVAAAEDIGFPVVMKIDAPAVPHRNHIGAVRTGIEDADDARNAYEEIRRRVRKSEPEAEIHGVVVQPQVSDGVEVLVGITHDPDFGPLVTVGSGGTTAEAIGDERTVIPPFTHGDALVALEQTNVPELLTEQGYGSTMKALADLLVEVGTLAQQTDSLAELDLNPVIVTDEGLHIVDVLARTQ